MGPTDAKKTTISANIPGRAKRLEGEGKIIRKATRYQSPIIIVDSTIRHKWHTNPWTASNKNIEKEKIQYAMLERQEPEILKLTGE